ncbi:MAG: DinB family protein [Flavobacterium sp.]|nr:MAG: DinB family protein [Flavobacterium sp.]
MLLNAIRYNFAELTDLLRQLSNEDYSNPCEELGNVSIGEHLRHILEMYQILTSSYESGHIDYDKRERNLALQTDTALALETVDKLVVALDKPNKNLDLRQCIDGESFSITTNYHRELLYNLEHSIHHQALIKVAVRQCAASVSDDFGVARSTIEYRSKCAQ